MRRRYWLGACGGTYIPRGVGVQVLTPSLVIVGLALFDDGGRH